MQAKAKMNTKAMKANAKKSENIQSAFSCFWQSGTFHSSTYIESDHERTSQRIKAVNREIFSYRYF